MIEQRHSLSCAIILSIITICFCCGCASFTPDGEITAASSHDPLKISIEADDFQMSATVADKAFFQQIKTAILNNDTNWLSSAISYPITIKTDRRSFRLRKKRDFNAHAALLLTPHFKAVVQQQSPDSLVKNWAGIMIGDGEIWFSKVEEISGTGIVWVYRIIAFNLPTAPTLPSPPRKLTEQRQSPRCADYAGIPPCPCLPLRP
jgi:hypothetical protein